jgi:hypothetical protein
MAHHKEQVGDYVVELLDAKDWWHVRMAGADPANAISMHNTKREALAAVKRYQQGDTRRSRAS